jgi:hypothetical protein
MVVSFYVHYPREVAEQQKDETNVETDQPAPKPKSFVTLLDMQMNNKKAPSVLSRVLNLLKYMFRQYNALIFHAILNLILTFDRKDWTTFCLFGVEAITIPVHLFLLFKSSTSRPRYPLIFYTYLPILFCCILVAFFRYSLYFQK